MAQHTEKNEMIKEALQEMIEVAEYCIFFEKSNSVNWKGYAGCYGYPSAILLLSIVDSVGTLIEGGGDDTKIHFKILNNAEYYNLALSEEEIEIMRNGFRNKLSHNSHIMEGFAMIPGSDNYKILIKQNGTYFLNLKAFLSVSKKIVEKIIVQI